MMSWLQLLPLKIRWTRAATATDTLHSATRRVPARAAKRTAWSLAALGLIVAGITASDYGIAWDDSVQTRYGAMVLNYFLSGGTDRSYNDFLDLRLYGPPVELVGAALSRIAPQHAISMRHFLSAAIALLSIPALYRFGRLLGNPWLGVLAAVALWLMPRFYGHAFVNTKDIPFAIGMIASVGALAAMFARRQYRWSEIIQCGLLLGCTVSVRSGGWLLLGPTYILGAMFVDWRAWKTARHSIGTARRPKRRTLLKQGVMFAIAWSVMIVAWPWAHESPIWHPMQAINNSSRFHAVVPVLFDGQMLMSDALPRTYLLKYIMVTTPLVTLGLAVVGIATAAYRLLRGLDHRRAAIYWMLLVWLALPLTLYFIMSPNSYDGLRHFLFVLPAIALLAAIGLQTLFQQMPGRTARLALIATVVLLMTMPLGSIIRLHPYQIAHFNRVVGGTAGAMGKYDTEYWMTSYREAMEWIVDQHADADGDPIRILVAANDDSKWCATYYANDRIDITTTVKGGYPGDLPAEFTYYLSTTRTLMSDSYPDARIVKQVVRDGAVFAVVKQRRGDASSLAVK